MFPLLKNRVDFAKKYFAVLIDPDKADETLLANILKKATENKVDLFLVGGSLILSDNFSKVIAFLKLESTIPVLIFPGNNLQIDANADGILLLSLISGRNPEFLIGQHVIAAPRLKASKLEIFPTGYILIEGGSTTSVQYMSGTIPIPANKPEIALATALAGEQLGLKSIYLDAGSGASTAVNHEIIKQIKATIGIPLFVGGGVDNATKAEQIWKAGADVLVVGNAIEQNTNLISQISEVKNRINTE
jgi:phosphoglycerol geranylgeranyltransferase